MHHGHSSRGFRQSPPKRIDDHAIAELAHIPQVFAEAPAPAHAPQSTTRSPGTRSKSRMFDVTSVAPRRRAWAAMR